ERKSDLEESQASAPSVADSPCLAQSARRKLPQRWTMLLVRKLDHGGSSRPEREDSYDNRKSCARFIGKAGSLVVVPHNSKEGRPMRKKACAGAAGASRHMLGVSTKSVAVFCPGARERAKRA